MKVTRGKEKKEKTNHLNSMKKNIRTKAVEANIEPVTEKSTGKNKC